MEKSASYTKFKTMQNLERAFQCLRQILVDRNIDVKSKASVLSESGLYIRKLEHQIRLISYQNLWIKHQMECQQNLIEKNERTDSIHKDRPSKKLRLIDQKENDQVKSETIETEQANNSDDEIDVESV